MVLVFPHALANIENSKMQHINPVLSEHRKSTFSQSRVSYISENAQDGFDNSTHSRGPPTDGTLDNNDIYENGIEAVDLNIFGSQESKYVSISRSEISQTGDIDESRVLNLRKSIQWTNPSLQPLTLESDDFVTWFSKVNISRFRSPRLGVKLNGIITSSNTRDEPAPFQFCCGIGARQF